MSEDQATRRRLELVRQAEKGLRDMGGVPMDPILAEKTPGGKNGKYTEGIVTNVYGLKSEKPDVRIYRYDVRITGVGLNRDIVFQSEITGQCSSDTFAVDRRDSCRAVFNAFRANQIDGLLRGATGFYDLGKILFTTIKLSLNERGETFPIDCTDLPDNKLLFGRFQHFDIKISPVKEGSEISLGEFQKAIAKNLDSFDHTYMQFIDIVTSQYVFFTPGEHMSFSAAESYLMWSSYGFTIPSADELPEFEDMTYLGVGAKKNARFIEGPNGRGNAHPALVVAAKKIAFHAKAPLVLKAQCYVRNLERLVNGELEKLNKAFTGLFVETNHDHTGVVQKFKIHSVIEEGADVWKFAMEGGREITVQDYMREEYGFELEHPKIPLVVKRNKSGRLDRLPMELCIISDNQRVRTEQYGKTLEGVQEKVIKMCAVPPSRLKSQIERVVDSLCLRENEYLNSVSLKFIHNPLKIKNARVLPSPSIEFAGGEKSVILPKFTWKGKRYLLPKSIGKWAAFAFLGRSDKLTEDELRRFIDRFIECGQTNGMTIDPVSFVKVQGQVTKADLVEVVKEASEQGYEFFLMVHPISFKTPGSQTLHDALKFAERKHSVTTQNLLVGTVQKVIRSGQAATLNNILHKANMKLGGINYSLRLDSPIASKILGGDTLFIGIGANHPRNEEYSAAKEKNVNGGNGSNNGLNGRNGTNGNGVVHNGNGGALNNGKRNGQPPIRFPPSVIGFAANMGESHPFEFIGDFFYQEPLRDEKPVEIRRIVVHCVEKFRVNRKMEPRRIIIYRTGSSDEQFSQMLKYEVPFIKIGLEAANCSAKFTIIVPTKLHHIRFFREQINSRDTTPNQNITPGTVIDTTVVHPTISEFYLNAHTALQGTAKTPRFSIIYDELKMGLDDYEGITYQLCYGHQIVFSPTSLPTPVYVANCYAERGQNLYREWRESRTDRDEDTSYQSLEEQLTYHYPYNNPFGNRRINA